MCDCERETYRTAVILCVETVTGMMGGNDEAIHHLGNVVKSVCEGIWGGMVAVTEAGIVERNQMVLFR